MIPFLLLGAAAASAQPIGASVVAGQARVSSSGATTTINQSTAKAIINWQDFSVGAGAAVQFNQPSAAAITLNRVTGSSISTINGAIRANGQVWLLNPNGLLFGSGATINVGGLLATTSDIADQDFIDGRYNFSGGRGAIINNGSIKARSGGSVVLSAPNIANNGLIAATAGHVVLGGTDTFTVDFNGDHLLSYAVSTSSQTGQVTNTGKISAAGGTILLTARAAAGVQDVVINNTGMIQATSVRSENGEIILDAGDGSATTSGTLDASGKAAGQTGGTVKVLGQQVAVADGARIDVSGNAGGGTAMIGGNLHGAGPEPNAQNTILGKATINASAISRGNGGTVAVYSTGTTKVAATITAQGGIISGNGGMVETSGHLLGVDTAAFVSTLAPHGKSGSWLLDPDFIDITTSGCTALGTGVCVDNTFSSTGTNTISPTAISNALASGNVDLQANFDITVSNAVSASSSNTLYLEAGRSIILTAGLQNTGGEIALFAGDTNTPAVLAGGTVPSGATISGAGVLSAGVIQISLGAAGSIGTSVQPIMISDAQAAGNLGLSVNSLGADAFIQTAGGILASQISIENTATAFAFGLGNHPGVNLTNDPNGTIAASTAIGSFQLLSSVPLLEGWGVAANNLTVSTTGASAINFTDVGQPSFGDIGNQIAGQANFTTASGDVSYGNTLSTGTVLGTASIAGNFTVTASAFGPPFASTPTTTYYPLSIAGAVNATGTVNITATDIQQVAGGSIAASSAVFVANAGSVGSSATPLSIGNGGAPITVSASSTTTGIFLSATGALQVGGQVDANYAIDAGAGDVSLTATGNILQTPGLSFGIAANNLTVTSTGGSVTLADVGSCCSAPIDNGNVIAGTARFNTASNVSFTNADSQTFTTTIGSSTVGGSLTVLATETSIALADGAGSISVAGPASLTSNVGSISQTIPLTSAGLSASVGNGGIALTNAANAVNGTATFQVPFDGGAGAAFTNSVATTLGTSSIGAGNFGVTSTTAGLNVTGAVSAPGGLVLTAAGTITQTSSGVITTSSAVLTNLNVSGSIFLGAANNAISSAAIFAGTSVSLFDTGNLTLLRLQGTTGSTSIPSGAVTIQDNGNLTLASSASGATVSAGNIAVLHASGSIFASTGTAISAPSLSLIADSGSIGMPTAPLNIATNLLAARTSSNNGISIFAAPVSGSSLTLTTITSGANGNIGATNNTGLNAGTANIAITGNAVMSFSGNSITAGNLRLTGFTTINASSVSIASLSAQASGAINISSVGGFQINNLTGGVGIQTPGAVTLNTLGTISAVTGIAGSLATGNLTASVNAGGGFGLFLGDGMNAVTGSVTLNAPGPITFFNSVNTNIFRANYIPASTAVPAASVDIEAFGASTPTLTIGAGVNQNGTSISGNTVTLRGMGGILQSGTGAIGSPNITLISGFGSIGTATAPIRVQAGGGALLANTGNKDINLAFTLVQGSSGASIELGLPTSSMGFSAGTGNINISAPSVFVNGFTTITAASLNITSSAGVELDDVEVGSLSVAASGGNSIDINSDNGFQLNNPFGGPAISTTGDAQISVSSGSITQAAGASGAITAGTFSSFAVGGNNFNNPANAISSDIEIGSLANTTLVNSLSTHLDVALAAGTLTVQSAGDLVLVAGPTIAALSAAGANNGTNFKSTGSGNNSGSGNGGININGTVVVSAAALSQLTGNLVSLSSSGDGIVLAASGSFINNAGPTALLLPNGARFLVYANQFSTSVLGGLTTVGDGIFNTSYPTPITASGSRFVFAGAGSLTFTPASTTASTSTSTSTSTPSDVLHDNATTAPVLVGFVTAQQPPPRSPPPPPPPPPPPLSDLLTVGPLAPPPPPPPPPVQSPLADNNSEQPVSSDQSTSQVANSLDGGTPRPGQRGAGGTVIPRMLVNARPPAPPPTDATALSSFGNSSLWQ